MKKEIAELWTKALRSGEYKQGQDYLCRGGLYCCIGVLSDLAAKAGAIGIAAEGDVTVFDGHKATAPQSVQDWSGMQSPVGHIKGETSLVDMNDGKEPHSFAQIADHIEANWERL